MKEKNYVYPSDITIERDERNYFVSRNLWYKHKNSKNNILRKINLLDKIIPKILKCVDVDESKMRFRLCSIRGRYGQTSHRFVELNLRLLCFNDDLIKTVAHELVHMEQFQQKRLTVKLLPNYRQVDVWNGIRFCDHDKSNIETPWEQEAYRREKEIFEKLKPQLIKERILI
jgi:hypothetical protein